MTRTALPTGAFATVETSSRVSCTSVPSKVRITSPASIPASFAGPVRNIGHQGAPGSSSRPIASATSSGTRPECARPSQPRRVSPKSLQLVHDHVGQRRSLLIAKPIPIEPPLGRQDRSVHADNLTVHIKERAARVTAVDRRVGLDEVVKCCPESARLRVAEMIPAENRKTLTQRVAHGQDPVADARRLSESPQGTKASGVSLSTFRSARSVFWSVPINRGLPARHLRRTR